MPSADDPNHDEMAHRIFCAALSYHLGSAYATIEKDRRGKPIGGAWINLANKARKLLQPDFLRGKPDDNANIQSFIQKARTLALLLTQMADTLQGGQFVSQGEMERLQKMQDELLERP